MWFESWWVLSYFSRQTWLFCRPQHHIDVHFVSGPVCLLRKWAENYGFAPNNVGSIMFSFLTSYLFVLKTEGVGPVSNWATCMNSAKNIFRAFWTENAEKLMPQAAPHFRGSAFPQPDRLLAVLCQLFLLLFSSNDVLDVVDFCGLLHWRRRGTYSPPFHSKKNMFKSPCGAWRKVRDMRAAPKLEPSTNFMKTTEVEQYNQEWDKQHPKPLPQKHLFWQGVPKITEKLYLTWTHYFIYASERWISLIWEDLRLISLFSSVDGLIHSHRPHTLSK